MLPGLPSPKAYLLVDGGGVEGEKRSKVILIVTNDGDTQRIMLGFPASGIECLMISGGADTIIVEIKVHSK